MTCLFSMTIINIIRHTYYPIPVSHSFLYSSPCFMLMLRINNSWMFLSSMVSFLVGLEQLIVVNFLLVSQLFQLELNQVLLLTMIWILRKYNLTLGKIKLSLTVEYCRSDFQIIPKDAKFVSCMLYEPFYIS